MIYFIVYLLFAVSGVLVLDNGLARTPPMGWMSWGYYMCGVKCDQDPEKCLNEDLIISVADAFFDEGYQEAGYEYIIIDDCWSEKVRDSDDRLVPDAQRFPHGMKFLADYIHKRGLKFGMYTNIASVTCMHYPGSRNYFVKDAETFASWGVDYLKVDGCFVGEDFLNEAYINLGRALNNTGRPMVYSCSWPYYIEFIHHKKPEFGPIAQHCNMWRNYHDVFLNWPSVQSIVRHFELEHARLAPHHGPAHWNDPDMLIFGTGALTEGQSRVQLSVYVMLSAPLLISCNMRRITPFEKQLLLNLDLIVIDQDPLGIMATPHSITETITLWVKQHYPRKGDSYPSFSFLFVNMHRSNTSVLFSPAKYGLNSTDGYTVMNVFTSKYLKNITLIDIFAVDIPMEDIERAINKLKTGSSPGPDNLPSFILKGGKKHFILPLHHILNMSLKNGQYPSQWKLSRVTPIPKSSKKTLVEEYRPIAILCAPAKVFEYIFHSEISRQVKQQLGEEQHGFRSGRSVSTNLLELVDYISSAMDRGLQVDVIYFDFQKAFDKIDNDILLHKVASDFGFSPALVNFFSDFMRNRNQYVRHGTYESGPYHTRSGVSQGSVTGPMFFQMLIYDLPKVLTSAKCLLYADDLKLFLEIKSPNDCLGLQNDIDRIYEWSVKNKMIFNINKCNVMTFDRKSKPIHFNYCLNSCSINRVHCVKDLGVTFDRKLTFHDHISDLAKEAYRRLGFVLRNAKDFPNPQVLNTLYNSLVRSKLESSACVWNPHHVKYTQMLEKVQKTFLRSLYKKCYGYYPYMYPTKFLLGQLGYNSLEVRRMLDQLSICCKVLRGMVDSIHLHDILCALFVPDEPGVPANRRGRPQNLFQVDHGRTATRSMSPLIRARRHFNALLAANTDFDIMSDDWKSVVNEFRTYCEGLIDQWDRSKRTNHSLDDMDFLDNLCD